MKTDEVSEEVERQLTKIGYWKNWVHGGLHINEVKKVLNEMLKCGLEEKLNERMIKCLRIAVDVHDIGRGEKGDHAVRSKEILAGMQIDDITKEEHKNILFAVENHSKGLAGIGIDKAEKDKEILLGFLVLLDHMDALGVRGYLRPIEVTNLLLISKRRTVSELQNFIDNPEKIGIDNIDMKNESIIAHLIYNYCATTHIIKPIREFLNKDMIVIVEVRKEQLFHFIYHLMDTQRDLEKL